MNFRYRLMQFMSGRYGFDNLNKWLTVTAAVIAAVNLFIRYGYLRLILQSVVYIVLVYVLFRTFSRNIEARRRENIWFNDKVLFFSRKKELYEKRKNDAYHIYKKCPRCKAVLRLPRRIGTHKTVCPRCSYEFSVKVRK